MTRITKYLLIPIGILACAYAVFCVFLYLTQRSYLYYPPPGRDDGAISTMHLHRRNADLLVSVVKRAGPSAILYFGGNAEDVSRSLPLLSTAFPGAAIYAMHYRGYTGSTGKPTEKALVADGMDLFDIISNEHPQITLVGRSLGSGVAIQVASQRQASRLVLVTPYNSIAELAARKFRYVPIDWLLLDRYESWKYAPTISVPTTIVAAENDLVIPMSSTRQLLAHFKPGVATFQVIPDAGHNDIARHAGYVAALSGAPAQH